MNNATNSTNIKTKKITNMVLRETENNVKDEFKKVWLHLLPTNGPI